MMRRDKMAATFGAAYWQRDHPDVDPMVASRYLMRREWRRQVHAAQGAADTLVAALHGIGARAADAGRAFGDVGVAVARWDRDRFTLTD